MCACSIPITTSSIISDVALERMSGPTHTRIRRLLLDVKCRPDTIGKCEGYNEHGATVLSIAAIAKAMSTNVSIGSDKTTVPRTVDEDLSQAAENPSKDPTGPPARILWYRNDIGPRLKPDTRNLLETYAGISGEELMEHLHNVVSRTLKFWKLTRPTTKACIA